MSQNRGNLFAIIVVGSQRDTKQKRRQKMGARDSKRKKRTRKRKVADSKRMHKSLIRELNAMGGT